MITLAQIAKSVKVSPKVARRRLRDAGRKARQGHWVFDKAKRAEIIKIVRG